MAESPTPRLDRIETAARRLEVSPGEVERARAHLLARTTPRHASPWRTLALVFGGALLVGAIALALVWPAPGADAPRATVAVGPRVIAIPGADSRIATLVSAPDETVIAVTRGAVTVRLYPGASPHRLEVRGGGVAAVAMGTSYSLALDRDGAPTVFVHAGQVAIVEGDTTTEVHAGHSHPPGRAVPPALAAAARQLAAAAPPQQAPTPDASAVDAGTARLDAAASAHDAGVVPSFDAGPRDLAPGDVARPRPLTAEQRWQRARLLRGQGKYREAIAANAAVVATGHPTWAPLAQLEIARVHLDARDEAGPALAAVVTFLRAHPGHPLVPDARELACRAARRLSPADITPAQRDVAQLDTCQ